MIFDGNGDWLPTLLVALDQAQQRLLEAMTIMGLAGQVHGQPAWPWSVRVAVDVLAIDRSLARALLLALAALGLALALVAVSVLWRRGRVPLWATAATVLAITPWPPAALLFGPAVPSSFHQSTSGFTSQSILLGRRLFLRHCADCHGHDAGGEGPRAASLTMWPPDLGGALLWRRTDGELLWHLLHGMQDRSGRQTMPGFDAQMSVAEAWSVLDFLRANAAGQTLKRTGAWSHPVPLPDATVRCDDGTDRALRSWVGQRLRIVAMAPGQGALVEDPRLVSVALPGSTGSGARSEQCRVDDPDAQAAFALLSGVTVGELAGTQFLADRAHWLRARSAAGDAGWNDSDFVCRSSGTPRAQGSAQAGGLDRLIARMDAEPVRFLKGGIPH